jgi:hypothetical protein
MFLRMYVALRQSCSLPYLISKNICILLVYLWVNWSIWKTHIFCIFPLSYDSKSHTSEQIKRIVRDIISLTTRYLHFCLFFDFLSIFLSSAHFMNKISIILLYYILAKALRILLCKVQKEKISFSNHFWSILPK